jgi:hypothetical protein
MGVSHMSQLVDTQVSHCILGISTVSCLEESSPTGSSFYPVLLVRRFCQAILRDDGSRIRSFLFSKLLDYRQLWCN